jgi:hypothetical protein
VNAARHLYLRELRAVCLSDCDRWNHLFRVAAARVRAYGERPLAAGRHWLDVPRDAAWIF